MVYWRKLIRLFLVGLAASLSLVRPLLGMPEEEPAVTNATGCWQAAITEQWVNLELAGSVLRVSVQGKAGLPVMVRSIGDFQTVGWTGTKPEYGPFVAEFAPLGKGDYLIEPQGLGLTFPIWLDGRNYMRVDFKRQPCAPLPTATPRLPVATPRRQVATSSPSAVSSSLPPAPTPRPQPTQGWQGRTVEHRTNPVGVHWATIVVRVIGRPAGQEVEIRSANWGATQKTGTKPEHGPDACEFGGLSPGTYTLSPRDLATSLQVAVVRGDFVRVEFYPTGGGASSTRWLGSEVKNTSSSQPTEHTNSAIAVIVAGRPWHEVEIRSNGWSATAQTGSKPEYGPDACEFGGLRAGTYTITPRGLGASARVTVDGWGWALVRFDPRSVPVPLPPVTPPPAVAGPTQPARPAPSTTPNRIMIPRPTPIPPASHWRGWVVSNSSGERQGTGIGSVIIVRVRNRAGVGVAISGGGGWSVTCITGAKPEYGPDACEFGGLWPGTYILRPEGADTEVAVKMDGLGVALVEFAAP